MIKIQPLDLCLRRAKDHLVSLLSQITSENEKQMNLFHCDPTHQQEVFFRGLYEGSPASTAVSYFSLARSGVVLEFEIGLKVRRTSIQP